MNQSDPILESASAEYARRSLRGFVERMMPALEISPHIAYMIDVLERMERCEAQRVIVNIPPRHFKSTLCSMLFPAWALGRNPRRNIILATHSQELSDRNSRMARAYVQDDHYPFDAKLSAESTAVQRWEMKAGGGVYAVGVGGNITGRGADIFILDDVMHDAASPAESKSVWTWWTDIAVSRLQPSGAILSIGTRFSADDWFGRIEESPSANDWERIILPAFAKEHDPLGRKLGEPLWPTHIPTEDLLLRKRDMGGRSFEAQFMQDPIAGGSMFQPAWFENNRYATLPETFDRVVMSVDCASKTAAANDWSVVAVIGERNNDLYLIDVARRKVAFTDLVRMVLEMYAQHQPTSVYIEDTSAGIALCQLLEESDRYLPITKIKPTLKKEVRWQFITPACEQGRLRLPKDSSWLVEFEKELFRVPGGHDDQIDAVSQALTELLEDSGVTIFGLYGTDSGFGFEPKYNEWGRHLGNLPR